MLATMLGMSEEEAEYMKAEGFCPNCGHYEALHCYAVDTDDEVWMCPVGDCGCHSHSEDTVDS